MLPTVPLLNHTGLVRAVRRAIQHFLKMDGLDEQQKAGVAMRQTCKALAVRLHLDGLERLLGLLYTEACWHNISVPKLRLSRSRKVLTLSTKVLTSTTASTRGQ